MPAAKSYNAKFDWCANRWDEKAGLPRGCVDSARRTRLVKSSSRFPSYSPRTSRYPLTLNERTGDLAAAVIDSMVTPGRFELPTCGLGNRPRSYASSGSVLHSVRMWLILIPLPRTHFALRCRKLLKSTIQTDTRTDTNCSLGPAVLSALLQCAAC